MFMEAEDRRRLSLMLLSVDRGSHKASNRSLNVTWRGVATPTQVQQPVQLLSAEHHISVTAELDAAELQDVKDLLPDGLQRRRMAHQVVQRPERGGNSIGHRRPEDGEVMS